MATTRSTLLAALCLSLCAVSANAYFKGDGTAYSGDYEKDKTGFNSCQFKELPDRWEKYYGAIPSHMFDRERDCGQCVLVRGTEAGASGKWVKVMIVDECASCQGDGDIDFSTRALEEITGFSWDRKLIEWEWTSCDDDEEGATTSSVTVTASDGSTVALAPTTSEDGSDAVTAITLDGTAPAPTPAEEGSDGEEDSSSKKKDRRRRRKKKSSNGRRLMSGSQ